MTRPSTAVVAAAVAFAMAACSSSPSAPTVLSLAGNWTGPGTNMLGKHTLSLTIAQDGTALSGTVATKAADPTDGSCSSCHMNKTGTFTGTISSGTISLTMTFPSGNPLDPTPICSATMAINTTGATATSIAGPYTGSDTCEGPWIDSTVALTKQ